MRGWFDGGVFAVALLTCGLSLPNPAEARTNRALIVAVTAYPNLPPNLALVGPNNDARLVRDYLTGSAPVRFETGDVMLLADGIESAGSPTLGGIEKALAAIAARAEPGDFVYLHFSGHGSQQPALNPGTEPDGKDEIFLPADTGLWQDRAKGVPGAFADDRIGAALKAIRARGAFVWVVFDACNSGTATRATLETADDEAERKVEPADLGIPDAEMAEASGVAEAAATRGSEMAREVRIGDDPDEATLGGMVAFFAAQTVETTPELKLPKGDADAVKFGLFTYTLFSRLSENPNLTYRQLTQNILQSYAAENRVRPTPLFEGALDAPVFATEPGDIVQQWKVSVSGGKATLPAGMLHRLTPGSKLALLPSPGSPDEAALGYLEVTAAKNLTSTAKPVAYEGKPALKLQDIPDNAYARVAELAIDFRLKVARPAPSAIFPREVAIANKVLDEIAADATTPVSLELVDAGASADAVLAIFPERDVPGARSDAGTEPRLWFLPSTGVVSGDQLYLAGSDNTAKETDPQKLNLRAEGSRSRGLPIPDSRASFSGSQASTEFADYVRRNLIAIYRATNLARLTAASDFRANDIALNMRIKRVDTGAFEPMEQGTAPILHPDDEIHLDAKNGSSKPVDINILYVGADYSIIWGGGERLHNGDRLELPLFAITPTTYGMERVVVVMTEARPQTAVEDLSFLEQQGLKSQTRSVRGDVSSLLEALGGGSETRGAKKLGAKKQDDAARSSVMMFMMETRPGE